VSGLPAGQRLSEARIYVPLWATASDIPGFCSSRGDGECGSIGLAATLDMASTRFGGRPIRSRVRRIASESTRRVAVVLTNEAG
jgi:hypothetical protein